MKANTKKATPENNKLRQEDRAIHDWFRFVLSYPPHLVRDYIQKFNISSDMVVLDPFCGTGTTLVECKKLGITSVGIEANPSAYFASRMKVNWDIDPDGLIRHAENIAKTASKRLQSQGINDENDLPLFNRDSGVGINLRTLSLERMKLLLRDSISPLPLHKTIVLLEVIREQKDKLFYDHEKLALSKALVFDISNLHFGPEVGVRKNKKPNAPVVATWLKCVQDIAKDLRELNGNIQTRASVHMADSRSIAQVLEADSIDAVITSPPYPNEKDYTRTTRLESVILGFIDDMNDLRSLKKELVRSNTRSVYKADKDDLLVEEHQEIQRIADTIEKRRIEMGKTSGFERLYSRLTKLYFGGMKRHLSELRTVLRKDARLAYVVGDQASYLRVMIRTGQLLADIAQDLGYEVIGIDLFRTRLSTATKEQLREETVMLRWPGKKTGKRVRK